MLQPPDLLRYLRINFGWAKGACIFEYKFNQHANTSITHQL